MRRARWRLRQRMASRWVLPSVFLRAMYGNGGDAGGSGELGVGREALGAGDLADELGGGQRAAAGLGDELRGDLGHQHGDFGLEGLDGLREFAHAAQLVARDAHAHGLLGARQAPGDLRGPLLREQRAAGQRELGPEVVQVPLQRVVQGHARADETLAMVDEQPDVELRARQRRGRQGLDAGCQRGPGNRHRVDLIALAALAAGAPRAGHQSRGDANHTLTTADQKPLQRAGDMPAVLQRPHPLAIKTARPEHQRREPAGTDRDRLVAEHLAGRCVDGGDGVRALVGVRPEHDHDARPRPFTSGCWTPGGQGLLRALPRSYQVTPDIPDRRRATQQKEVRPNRPTASKRVSSPPGRDHLLGVGRHRPRNPNSKPQSGSAAARRVLRPSGRTAPCSRRCTRESAIA